MKNTKKRISALKALREMGADAPLKISQAERLENDELYKVLEAKSLRYEPKTQSWHLAQLAPSGGRMSANSMFETEDGLGSGFVRLRLMAHPNDLDALISAVKQNKALTVTDVSAPYPNRKGAGVRVYITASIALQDAKSKVSPKKK